MWHAYSIIISWNIPYFGNCAICCVIPFFHTICLKKRFDILTFFGVLAYVKRGKYLTHKKTHYKLTLFLYVLVDVLYVYTYSKLRLYQRKRKLPIINNCKCELGHVLFEPKHIHRPIWYDEKYWFVISPFFKGGPLPHSKKEGSKNCRWLICDWGPARNPP